MRAFAKQCSQYIRAGQVVFLQGDLGAGKTTLAKGLLAAWGVTEVVRSPTFTLVESYILPEVEVHHFDLYRLETSEELEMIGAREMFSLQSICLIEWPDKALGFLPVPDVCFTITYRGAGRYVELGGEGVKNIDLQRKYD
jgi:tRNA threonylcarbamoyladenosine biosynthesis protein TsaE